MLLPNDTLVAIVDGETLRLFRNSGTEARPRLAALAEPKLEGHNKGAGSRHHVSAANPQRSLLEEDSFAAVAADWLNQQAIAGKYEGFVVVAAPRTLGELRKHYHAKLKDKLVGELSKDFAKRPLPEIEAALADA